MTASPIQELDPVVLVCDLPAVGLQGGDVGAVVHLYRDHEAVEVEFVTGAGATVTVQTLSLADVRHLDAGDMLHARSLAA